MWHAGLTFVPISHLELGLRWAGGEWRAAARYQLLEQASHGVDLTVGLGLSRFAYEFPVGSLVDIIQLDDFTRYGLDVPLLVGTHASWYRLWGGPRLLFSHFDAAMRLNLPAAAGSPAETELASVQGGAIFVGGQGGVALGYRNLFLGFELTIVRLVSSAHLQAAGKSEDVDLGGLIIYPGLALMGEF